MYVCMYVYMYVCMYNNICMYVCKCDDTLIRPLVDVQQLTMDC